MIIFHSSCHLFTRGEFMSRSKKIVLCFVLLYVTACASAKTGDLYLDPNMDFGTVKTVGVMPFINLARDPVVADRVRDVVINKLLASGAVYVVPVGEVSRGITRSEISSPTTPSPEEAIKLGGIIQAQAIITGAVREYGEARSGSVSANIVSVSLEMIETQTGKIVWAASSTQGGITMWDRFFGGGGQPMNTVTEKAVDDLLNKLLK